MAKQVNKVQGAATAVVVGAPTVVAAGKPATPGVLVVKPGVALRGARAAWYATLLAYNGKPVAEFLAHCAANPPSVPKSGVVEKPQGWLGWFTRNAIATVQAPAP